MGSVIKVFRARVRENSCERVGRSAPTKFQSKLANMRIGVLTSHPIQYQAPYFRALTKRADLHVFFAHRPTAEQQGSGFGRSFNWDVDLLSGYSYTFLRNKAKNPGTNSFFGCDTPEIKEVIRTGHFDAFIVSGWFLKSYWQAVRACKRNKVPVLVRGDSQLRTPRSRVKRGIKLYGYHLALKQFDGFLTVGQRNREYLLHYGIPEKKLFFAPHFVDNDWFADRAVAEGPHRREIRAQWSANDSTFIALFAGKFIPEKRMSDLVRAVGVLKARGRDITAVLIGAGELEEELRGEAELRRVNIKFEGFKNQTELPAYYCVADAFVLPSSSETWGLAVNEAMACGLPAIVSDAVGCAPDLIDEGCTGFTYPVGDVRALADRLEEIAELKDHRFDFRPYLKDKLAVYSLKSAVDGTVAAVQSFLGAIR